MEKKANKPEQLRELINKNCGQRCQRINPKLIGEICDENGVQISIKEMLECINELTLKHSAERIMPDIVKEMFKEYIHQTKPNRALLLFSGANDLPESVKEYEIDVLPLTEDDAYIADRYNFKKVCLHDKIEEKFQLILADLPFMVEEIYLNALNYCVDNLAKNGRAVFVFPAGIAFNKKLLTMINKYEKEGLFSVSYIDLPMSTYMPLTNIKTTIVVFEKNMIPYRHIAKVCDKYECKLIVSNFIKKEKSEKPALGLWIDPNEFSNYETYEKTEKNKKLSKLYGGQFLELRNVLKEINRPNKDNEFTSMENALYFPIIGITDVVSSVTDFKIKSQNYIQIIVDDEKVLPGYVLYFFNTDRGRNIRKTFMQGCIPKFTKDNIKDVPIIVPSIIIQNDILNTYQMIRTLENQIISLKNRFDEIPISYKTIQKSIANINNEETLESWINIIPFPIASILRKYIIEDRNDKKQDVLFHFFESYALFHTSILLSIVYANRQLIETKDFFKGININYYERASFGNWVLLGQKIANAFREMLSSKSKMDSGFSKKDIVFECFKTKEEALIKVLCKKNIYTILNNASIKRNDWKGHSGVANDVIYENHVRELEELLQKLKLEIEDLYTNIELIRASSMTLSHEIYSCRIERLMGSNSSFKKETFTINQPLETPKVYIRIKDTDMVIELVPFIIFKDSPSNQNNACYFYSKVEKGETKYISYHYEDEPEDFEPGEAAFDIIKKLIGEE